MFPEIDATTLPFLTTEQMVEVDRAMIEDYGILLIQMMENAGRNLARLARERFLSSAPKERRVAILAGVGGNGGGAMVSARRLQNWGFAVEVFTSKADADFTEVPGHQLRVLRSMGISCSVGTPASGRAFDLIVDGVIGYSLSGAPRGVAADLIRWANAHPAPVLALDAPSGLDATTGSAFEPAVRAVATMTLALPKEGLRGGGADAYVGDLYLADISVPPELYASPALGLDVGPVFSESEVVRLV